MARLQMPLLRAIRSISCMTRPLAGSSSSAACKRQQRAARIAEPALVDLRDAAEQSHTLARLTRAASASRQQLLDARQAG